MTALDRSDVAIAGTDAGTDSADPTTCKPFLRFGKLTGKTRVPVAAKHNKRSGGGEHWRGADLIDRARSHLNYTLAGPSTADEVIQLYKRRLREAALGTIRKDAVRAIEFVASLHPDVPINRRTYFGSVVGFVSRHFGGDDNILSADVHLDEAAPHLHVLVVPLFDGRLRGSDAIGGFAKVCLLHERFHAEVGINFGLLPFSRRADRRPSDNRTQCTVWQQRGVGAGGLVLVDQHLAEAQ
jgi:hypothetical protein